MKRILLPLGLVVIVGVYFGISAVLYTRLSSVAPRCGGEFSDNTPAQFSAEPLKSGLDTAPYWMPEYQTVGNCQPRSKHHCECVVYAV